MVCEDYIALLDVCGSAGAHTHIKRERRRTIALITAPHGQFRRLPTSSSCHSSSSKKTFPVFEFSASVGFVGVVFEVGEHVPRD